MSFVNEIFLIPLVNPAFGLTPKLFFPDKRLSKELFPVLDNL
jgi:hypothetical protein